MRAGPMGSQLRCARHLADTVKIVARRFPPIREVSLATRKVVVRRFSPFSRFDTWQITDSRAKGCADKNARSRRKLRWKKSGEITAYADDELAPPFLWHAERKRIGYLRDDTISE